MSPDAEGCVSPLGWAIALVLAVILAVWKGWL